MKTRQGLAGALLTVGSWLLLAAPAFAIVDDVPPQITCPAPITVQTRAPGCQERVEFAVTAFDEGDAEFGDITVVETVPASGSLFPVGTTTVQATATDGVGNRSTCSFTVTVRPADPTPQACSDITVDAETGKWGATVFYSPPTGGSPCLAPGTIVSTPPPGSFFPVGKTEVRSVATLDGEPVEICRFTVTVRGPNNIVWPSAQNLPLTSTTEGLVGEVFQGLSELGESRWFKVRIQPGGRFVAVLSSLPANYDLMLFRDIAQAYRDLLVPEDLSRLDAEFADDAFAPAQFSPAQFSPAQFSATAFAPAQFSPAQFSPAQFSPAQFSPAQFSPAQFSPDAFAPAQFSPAQFSPAQFSPAQFSPAQFSPAQFSGPVNEEAYASAQVRSLIAISAFESTANEGVIVNTWNESGDFYLRVRGRNGAFDQNDTFQLNVVLYPGLCADILPTPVDSANVELPPSTTAAPAGGYKTLFVTDLDRLVGPGSSTPRTELLAKLSTVAARPEVGGYVLDVGTDPRVVFFRNQAEANPECPYAKNLLAEEIRGIIDRSRTGNALEYVVLLGSDAVIPYFRHPDEAMLGPEEQYVPPVLDQSASQASLRENFFLSQDRYAARCIVRRKTSQIPLPDLAIGRLVESPSEIGIMLDAYLELPGGVLPSSQRALVTGYDFLDDAANAVADELHAGMALTPDRLITPFDVAPLDPLSWSADQLRALLKSRRHDLLFLAGHFSTASLLAADFTTTMRAAELLDPAYDLKNAFVYSVGCHSGYNLVDSDAINGVTLQPDWSQALARRGAILLAGTGYQYGDTDFIEYSERLYLEFTRNLRRGSGPVALGKALALAKKQYLASTADLRGIHEKSLLQATLFGLPMARYDFAGARLDAAAPGSVIPGVSPLTTPPGSVLGLQQAELTVNAALTKQEMDLVNAEYDPANPADQPSYRATWYSGTQGVISNPAEPVLPLEIRNVDVAGLPLRGIGFRSADYLDEEPVTPLTGAATTEIRGVHPAFVSEAFFPARFWRANYFGDLCGTEDLGTRLIVTPAQVRTFPGQSVGILRRYPTSQFRLFYSANIETYTEGGSSATPALSAPPSIVSVTTRVEGTKVFVTVQVIGNPAAGIQSVWITHTGTLAPFFGKWRSLDLTQDLAESSLWKGELELGAVPASSLRFIVQAVNGVGLVALDSNFGRYHIPGVGNLDTAGLLPSQVTWVTIPTSGRYGERTTIAARLSASGVPIPGRTIRLKLGTLETFAVTDTEGVGQVRVNLLQTPGTLPLVATFAGDETIDSSSVSTQFELSRAPSVLNLSPTSAIGRPNSIPNQAALLTDAAGQPLLEQPIVFVLEDALDPTRTFTTVVVTDHLGRAALNELPLPEGTYRVNASFGSTLALPGGGFIGSPSTLYLPSTAEGWLSLDDGVPVAADDTADGRAGQGLKIPIASLLENDIDPGGGALQLDSFEATTGRGSKITRSGEWLLVETLPAVPLDAFRYSVKDTDGLTSSARVVIRLAPDEGLTSNVLGVTFEDARVVVRFAGIPGRRYGIQFTPGLSPPDWQNVGSVIVGADGVGIYRGAAPTSAGYFRTVYPAP